MSKPTTPIEFGDVELNGHIISIPIFLIKNGKPAPKFIPSGKSRCRKCNTAVVSTTAACTVSQQPAPAERKSERPNKSPVESHQKAGNVNGANQRPHRPKVEKQLPFNSFLARKASKEYEARLMSNDRGVVCGMVAEISGEVDAIKKRIQNLQESLVIMTKTQTLVVGRATALLMSDVAVAVPESEETVPAQVEYVFEDEEDNKSDDRSQNGDDNAGNNSRQWGVQCDESENQPLSVGSREPHVDLPSMDDYSQGSAVQGYKPP